MMKSCRKSPAKICLKEALGFFFIGIFCFPLSVFASSEVSVCFKSICFHPEVARLETEKQHGLMGREGLPEGGGMLFVYDREGQPFFWMKNMQIPLDFVWIDGQGTAVDLIENVPVCRSADCPTVESKKKSRYVLEIPAGSIQKFGIQLNDHVLIQWKEAA